MKKELIGIIVCMLLVGIVLVSIPNVNADDRLYPKEDGPYFFLIWGRINGMGSSSLPGWDNITSPFWNLTYPKYISYHFRIFSIFIVNNTLQNIRHISFPAHISLYGFKGFGPTHYMVFYQGLGLRRKIVIGKCDEIRVHETPPW
jgi:hypothetical protein